MSFWGIIYFFLARASTLIGTAPSAGLLSLRHCVRIASGNNVIKIMDKS